MEQYFGLDVLLELTAMCVVDGSGKTLWQGKCASTPEAIAAAIRARSPEVARVGLESGPLSAWHWHELRKHGLPVICLDARQSGALAAAEQVRSQRSHRSCDPSAKQRSAEPIEGPGADRAD